VGSVPDLIVDGQSGLIIPPCNAKALAAAVIRYIDDNGLRERCAHAGYAAARPHTVEHFLQPLVDKAKELARRKKGDL
jgi:glycosyltransferase involved in cell wall biosynthesis